MTLRVIIAARGGADAKSRLAGRLDPRRRAALAEAMLADMLDALAACSVVSRAYVVTPTSELARLAARAGAVVMLESRPMGLNAAFDAARRRLGSLDSSGRLALLPGDLPRLTAREFEDAAAASEDGSIVVAPARADGGTGAIIQPTALDLPLAFGPDSFRRHRDAAAALGATVRSPVLGGLGFDIDRPDDLDRLAASPTQGRAAALARAFTFETGAAV
jgi:2-phospho-L-lactate guanylyltransferase